jgi:hypothetical protein
MEETQKKLLTQDQVAEKLLFPLFRCLDESFKKRYVRDIWEQFLNGMRSACYTDSLKVFVDKITKRLPITLQMQYAESIAEVLRSGQDEEILTWLREEATYMMLACRLLNQDRKQTLDERSQRVTGLSCPLPEVDPTLTF